MYDMCTSRYDKSYCASIGPTLVTRVMRDSWCGKTTNLTAGSICHGVKLLPPAEKFLRHTLETARNPVQRWTWIPKTCPETNKQQLPGAFLEQTFRGLGCQVEIQNAAVCCFGIKVLIALWRVDTRRPYCEALQYTNFWRQCLPVLLVVIRYTYVSRFCMVYVLLLLGIIGIFMVFPITESFPSRNLSTRPTLPFVPILLH